MTPRRTLCALLRLADPEALVQLRGAIRWTRGSVTHACRALDVSPSTLYGIAARTPAVAAVLEAEGVHRQGLARRRWSMRPTSLRPCKTRRRPQA